MINLKSFDDYLLDLIVESTKGKAPLIISDNLRSLLESIDHPISDKILESINYDVNYKQTYVDLDDSGLDKVSFLLTNKALEVLLGKSRIEDEDYKSITKHTFVGAIASAAKKDELLTSSKRSVTTIGKLINKLFPKEFPAGGVPGEDIQSFTNMFKSNREEKELELVDGYGIIKYYDEENYLLVNDELIGELGESCMRYDYCGDYLEFYAENTHNVSLLVLKEKDGHGDEKIKARALVWKLSQPKNRYFMDRIYTMHPYDEEHFKKYAIEKNWLYKKSQNSSSVGYIVDPIDGSSEYRLLVVKNMQSTYEERFPYLDTLKYYSPNDNVLTNDDDYFGNEKYYSLEDTGGGYEEVNSGIYVSHYDESYPEEDLVFCNFGDEYRLEYDAIHLEYYDETATEEFIDNEMVDCEDYSEGYGYDTYRLHRDTITLYDGSPACKEYAEDNLPFSSYHGEYLPDDKSVWSTHYNDYLFEPETVKVYLDAEQSDEDYRLEDDDTWFNWEDGENYDNDVSKKDLKKIKD